MSYKLENEIVVITSATAEILLKTNSDSLALYIFYINTAKRQKTNRIYATDTFCRKGLSWGRVRFQKAKDVLKENNFIKSFSKRKKGKITKHYIEVGYLWKKALLKEVNHTSEKLQVGLPPSGKRTTNALSNYNSNALSNKREMLINSENLENFQGKEINDLIILFKDVNPSYKKLYANKTERKALENLVKEHGLDKVTNMINYLDEIVGMPYAPVITKPTQLENKLGELRAFFKRMNNTNLQKIGGIVDARTN